MFIMVFHGFCMFFMCECVFAFPCRILGYPRLRTLGRTGCKDKPASEHCPKRTTSMVSWTSMDRFFSEKKRSFEKISQLDWLKMILDLADFKSSAFDPGNPLGSALPNK